MSNPNAIKTPLGRVRGMGSAKGGTHHWWMVKVTSVALIPLSLWFAWSIVHFVVAQGGTYDIALDWIKKPYNSFPLVLLLAINFYHAELGGQEVILDYIHNRKVQLPALMLYKFFCYGMAAISIYSVLFITFRM